MANRINDEYEDEVETDEDEAENEDTDSHDDGEDDHGDTSSEEEDSADEIASPPRGGNLLSVRHMNGIPTSRTMPYQRSTFPTKAARPVAHRGQPASTSRRLGNHSIRLVKILPGRSGSMISCSISVANLSQNPEYTAISYAWGSTPAEHKIVVNGSVQKVPANLWHFLVQAREPTSYRYLSGWLWIDRLSIDQESLEERAAQVKIISTIFGNARRVLVWLGASENGSDAVMKTLQKYTSADSYSISGKSAMLAFCERPYWRRLWVLQELRSNRNKELLCGNLLVSWSQLEAFLDAEAWAIRSSRSNGATDNAALSMIRLAQRTLRVSLWDLLEITQNLRCTEVRDKVFAILSVPISGHEGIVVDYTTSLPTLMATILRNYHKAVPPTTLQKTQQDLAFLSDLFRFQEKHMSAYFPHLSTNQHPQLLRLP